MSTGEARRWVALMETAAIRQRILFQTPEDHRLFWMAEVLEGKRVRWITGKMAAITGIKRSAPREDDERQRLRYQAEMGKN